MIEIQNARLLGRRELITMKVEYMLLGAFIYFTVLIIIYKITEKKNLKVNLIVAEIGAFLIFLIIVSIGYLILI